MTPNLDSVSVMSRFVKFDPTATLTEYRDMLHIAILTEYRDMLHIAILRWQ